MYVVYGVTTMKIKIFEIENHKGCFNFNYEKDLNYMAKEIKELIRISKVSVVGKVEKLADIYYISGKVKATLTLKCVRCLDEFEYPLEEEFKESFISPNVELDFEQDDEIQILENDIIDLAQIVEETTSIGIPYAPLCKDECKGICPSCGVNLNEETCDCKNESIDPRLADLAKWFDNK